METHSIFCGNPGKCNGSCTTTLRSSESTETPGCAEIHANAREATARQTFRAICAQDRPDIAVAILLRAIDEWYKKGLEHGKRV